jgi:hypothetical protein
VTAAGAELQSAIKRQVEFYFSRNNLANDAFLVSQMNSQMYVRPRCGFRLPLVTDYVRSQCGNASPPPAGTSRWT